jgi:hypothetical protein
VAPERITVTVDRHGEPLVFGAAEGDGCSVVEYVRVDVAECDEVRLYAEKMRRDRDETVQRCGSDILQILDGMA